MTIISFEQMQTVEGEGPGQEAFCSLLIGLLWSPERVWGLEGKKPHQFSMAAPLCAET